MAASRSTAKPPAAPPTVDPATARALKLWLVLSRAFNAVAAHTQADIAAHGLTPTEFGILEALQQKGPLLLGELQRRILLSSGGVTYTVDRMVEKGLIERRECPSDRRARYAALTPAGAALIGRIFPEHAARIAEAVSGLTARDQTEATRLLRTLGLHAASQLED